MLRKSTDVGATFSRPLEISDDGGQVPSCPHSGPSIGRNARGYFHVMWFTLDQAGIYYSVPRDNGKSFAPRQLIHGHTGPEILHTTLAVSPDGTVYFAWTNLDPENKSQVFFHRLGADGTWSPINKSARLKRTLGARQWCSPMTVCTWPGLKQKEKSHGSS